MTSSHDDALVRLASPCGARAEISLHGGQLLSWKPAGDTDWLYRSPSAVVAPGRALRGGVPVIFPQFADQGAGPRHGFARTRRWTLVQQDRSAYDALATLRLESDADTLAAWPYAFALELTVRIQGQELEMELAVDNTGDRSAHFQAALHSYWRVADSGRVSIDGLQDRPYRDAASGASGVQHSRCLELLSGRAIDRIVGGPAKPVILSDLATGRSLRLATEELPDVVVWNPGSEHGLADLPPPDWQSFVCVEVGAIETPVDLAAGDTWAARLRVSASA